MNDYIRMIRMFSLQRDNLSRLDRHTLAFSRRHHLFGDIRIPIGVHHDIPSQRRHHASYMQHPLRIGNLAGGNNTGRLPASFFVAVAKEAVKSGVKGQKEFAIQNPELKVSR